MIQNNNCFHEIAFLAGENSVLCKRTHVYVNVLIVRLDNIASEKR